MPEDLSPISNGRIIGNFVTSSSKPAALDEKTKQLPTIASYVRDNHRSVEDTLFQSLKGARFILVGESHLPIAMGSVVGSSLKRLNKEIKDKGENLIIALELASTKQKELDNLDYNLSEAELMKQIDTGLGTKKVLIAAKKEKVQVIYVDLPKDRSRSIGAVLSDIDNISLLNTRDQAMFDSISKNAEGKNKILFYGGSRHCSKTKIAEGNELHITLGSRLAERYGENSVISFRSTNYSLGLDNLSNTSTKMPTVDTFMHNDRVIVIPDGGEIQSKVGSYNFIIIDSTPNPYKK
jgi:hypothetical protein